MAAAVAAQVQVGFGKSRFGFVQPWVWRDTHSRRKGAIAVAHRAREASTRASM